MFFFRHRSTTAAACGRENHCTDGKIHFSGRSSWWLLRYYFCGIINSSEHRIEHAYLSSNPMLFHNIILYIYCLYLYQYLIIYYRYYILLPDIFMICIHNIYSTYINPCDIYTNLFIIIM